MITNPLHTLSAFLFRRKLRGAAKFHAVACGGKRIHVRTKHGVLLRLNPLEYVDGCVIREGFYEEEVYKAIVSDPGPGQVFWDIGANLGIHALTVARAFPSTKVYAFEPNPTLAELLIVVAKENEARVEVKQNALDNKEGTASFYVHEGNLGRSGLHNWENDPNLKVISVVTVTADSLVRSGELAGPNVIKIDVEGNELAVFEGMEMILQDKGLRKIVFEDSVEETSRVKRILSDAGFAIRPLRRLESTEHNLENYLATR